MFRVALLSVLWVVLPSPGWLVADWGATPLAGFAVADGGASQVVPKVAARDDGGSYVVWFDNSSGGYQVRLQRLDGAGVEQWPHNGIVVSAQPQASSLVNWDLICDSQGYAVVTFVDLRTGPDLDVQAYRVAPDSTMAWGVDGVSLSTGGGDDFDPQVAELSTGDFVFTWPGEVGGGLSILTQILSVDGQPQLPVGGSAIAGAPGENALFCRVVAAEDGQFILSWVRQVGTAFFSPRYPYVQKFESDLQPVWPADIQLFNVSLPFAYTAEIAPNGSGGAVLVWHTDPGGSFNCFVQHVDASGVELFGDNGVSVSTDATRNHMNPSLSYDSANDEVYVAWNERNATQALSGLHAQKISPSAQRLWGPEGQELAPLDSGIETAVRSIPSGDGLVIAYLTEPTFGQARVEGMRLDSDGAQMWSPEVVEVDGVASEKGRLPVAGAADGAMILIWEDGRGGDPDVYAQRLGLDGEIAGDSTVATSVQFQRGDCSSDDLFDIADAVSALGFLFVTGVPACVDACDGNDDGVFDISDPVFVLNALFLPGSSLPPAPHPTCGSDPTADTLDCVQPVCP